MSDEQNKGQQEQGKGNQHEQGKGRQEGPSKTGIGRP